MKIIQNSTLKSTMLFRRHSRNLLKIFTKTNKHTPHAPRNHRLTTIDRLRFEPRALYKPHRRRRVWRGHCFSPFFSADVAKPAGRPLSAVAQPDNKNITSRSARRVQGALCIMHVRTCNRHVCSDFSASGGLAWLPIAICGSRSLIGWRLVLAVLCRFRGVLLSLAGFSSRW